MEIIFCIVLIAIFLIFAFICVIKDEPIAAFFSSILAIIVLVILCIDVKSYDNNEEIDDYYEDVPGVIYDVSEFQIDTNIVINDEDTTKTYNIIYSN